MQQNVGFVLVCDNKGFSHSCLTNKFPHCNGFHNNGIKII